MTASDIQIAHPQSIRAVFFDAGFTMLAPHPSIVDIVVRVLKARGMPVDAQQLDGQFPMAEAALRRRAREHPGAWGDSATIDLIWTDYFTVLLEPVLSGLTDEERMACVSDTVRAYDDATSYALYPDVLPVLGALKAHGFTLGVISDWGIGLASILRHHDLIQYFDFAVISAAVRLAKPDPQLFETALRRADAIGDYAVHIGDSYVLDVLGARAAGITPILLDRARRTEGQALDCLVVNDLYGVLDLLDVSRPDEDEAAQTER